MEMECYKCMKHIYRETKSLFHSPHLCKQPEKSKSYLLRMIKKEKKCKLSKVVHHRPYTWKKSTLIKSYAKVYVVYIISSCMPPQRDLAHIHTHMSREKINVAIYLYMEQTLESKILSHLHLVQEVTCSFLFLNLYIYIYLGCSNVKKGKS